MSILTRTGWGLALILSICNTPGQDRMIAAADPQPNPPNTLASSAPNSIEDSRYEFNFSNGVLFSPFVATGHRPTINYTMTEVQFGYMLTPVRGTGWWRGNIELAAEGFASGIFEGDGSWIAGGTVWGRYNFVQPSQRFIPFGQLGLGMVSTDVEHKVVGQPFNFNIELGLGTRYQLCDHWSVNLEFRYQHISNADSGRHNIGINAAGPILGVSYLF